MHYSSCVPDISSDPPGREGAQRRANIRRQLRRTDAVAEPLPPATPRRNTCRGQPFPEPAGTPAPEEARPGTPLPARKAEGPTVATPAISRPPATPPHVVDNPATDPPADDTPTPSAPETRTPEVTRTELPRTTTQGRGPTPEQQRVIADLEAVPNTQQHEETTTRAMQFLASKAERQPIARHSQTERQRVARRELQAPDRIREASRLQCLYRTSKKRAVQKILDGINLHCQISKDTITTHFRDLTARRDGADEWPDVFDRDEPSAASGEALCAPFDREEVLRRLKGRTNTAAGPKGLIYKDLAKADPGAYVLTALYNTTWRMEASPFSWGNSTTILIYKKGDASNISNWRPISLGASWSTKDVMNRTSYCRKHCAGLSAEKWSWWLRGLT